MVQSVNISFNQTIAKLKNESSLNINDGLLISIQNQLKEENRQRLDESNKIKATLEKLNTGFFQIIFFFSNAYYNYSNKQK